MFYLNILFPIPEIPLFKSPCLYFVSVLSLKLLFIFGVFVSCSLHCRPLYGLADQAKLA